MNQLFICKLSRLKYKMMYIAYVPIFKDTLETTNLWEMVGKVQVEAVVSDVGNRIVAMDEDIYIPAIDKLRSDIVAMRRKKNNVQVKPLPVHSNGKSAVLKGITMLS